MIRERPDPGTTPAIPPPPLVAGCTVRQARETDAVGLLRLKQRVFAETDNLLQTNQDYDFDAEEERYLIRRYRNLENSALFVAVQGRDPQGFLSIQGGTLSRNRHVGQLGVAVRKDRWGCGIGGALMDAGLAWARDNAVIRKIFLLVYADNARAISLYDRWGFEREGLLRREVWLPERGCTMDLVAMGLLLDDGP